MLKLCKINACPNGTLGLHLSRAPYDPYPWVSGVLENSSAYQSGIRIGDTVLECNGNDVLGWKISELAAKIRNHWDCGGKTVNFLIWRSKTEQNTSTPAINQQSLQKFATCLQNIAQLLECPICLEVIKPPGWQCCNGHVLCNSCRYRSVKCPICRVPFGPRGRCLLSDKLFTLLAETFPCDSTKTGNKTGRCPQDNNKMKKNQKHAITSSSSPTESTRVISLEEIRTTPVKNIRNSNLRTIGTMTTSFVTSENSQFSANNGRAADTSTTIAATKTPSKITNPKCSKSGKQIISIKVNSKSSEEYESGTEQSTSIQTSSLIYPKNLTTKSSSSATVLSLPISLQNISRTTQTNTNVRLLHKNYHCPTGKSCIFEEIDKSYPAIHNTGTGLGDGNSLHQSQHDISTNKKKPEEENQNSNIMIATEDFHVQWSILTHLRRIHQMTVCQYHIGFGEKVQIDFMNNKSILCISIDTNFYKKSLVLPFGSNTYEKNSSRDTETFIGNFFQRFTHTPTTTAASTEKLRLNKVKNVDKKFCEKNFQKEKTSSNNTTIPIRLLDKSFLYLNQPQSFSNIKHQKSIEIGAQQETNFFVNGKSSRKCNLNDKIPHAAAGAYQISINCIEKVYDKTELFFIVKIPLPYEKICKKSNKKMLENCSCCENQIEENSLKKYLSDSTSSRRYQEVHCNQRNNFNNSNVASAITAISTHTTATTIATTEEEIYNTNDGAEGTVDSTNNNNNNNNHELLGEHLPPGNKKFAIFIWYCGNESNVKNFRAVIEFNRFGANNNGIDNSDSIKWTTTSCWIHPITKSWNSIKCQKEFHQIEDCCCSDL